jgi:hypothetical protein
MEKVLKKKNLSLEFPEEIEESKFYAIPRTINGKKDTINLFIWSDEDIAEAEKYDREQQLIKEESSETAL